MTDSLSLLRQLGVQLDCQTAAARRRTKASRRRQPISVVQGNDVPIFIIAGVGHNVFELKTEFESNVPKHGGQRATTRFKYEGARIRGKISKTKRLNTY